ncbi:MAG: MaoC family dehydratase [Paracoccaceae bacterium]|nr:MaoC family dehydratase [Paracoccaceae bacterium]
MSVPASLSLSALKAMEGQEIGRSDWVEISQARIDAFADVTEDWQAIHLDPSVGSAAGFDGTVAHGFLTLSMLSAMAYSGVPQIEGQVASLNYGFDRVRFTGPVPAGARMLATFTLRSLESRPDGSLMVLTGVTVRVEGAARAVLMADWRILYTFA